jgi:hypothetical protein
MKTVLILNAICAMLTMIVGLIVFGNGSISENQFAALTLFCVFISALSLYETKNCK